MNSATHQAIAPCTPEFRQITVGACLNLSRTLDGRTPRQLPAAGPLEVNSVSDQNSPRYRIQAVAERTGVPAATLRAWERRYGIPSPSRTDSAYRTYSEHDVLLIERLRQLCNSGLTPSAAANLIKEEAPQALVKTIPVTDREDVSHQSVYPSENFTASPTHDRPGPARDIYEATVTRLIAAVRGMNVEAIELELIRARELGSSLQIFHRILQPALEAVGKLWEEGRISIGHEHLATELLHSTARDLLRLSQPTHAARLALLGCFADELHTGGLYGVAFRFMGWGCRVAVIGALTPPEALGPAVTRLRPDVVGLSVTIPPKGPRAEELIEKYASACGDVPWIVGGRGAPQLAPLVTRYKGYVAPDTAFDTDELIRRVLQAP